VYIASLPFFAVLYQTFRVLKYAGEGKLLTPAAVKAVRTIKFCAVALIGFVAGAEVFIMLSESDDRAGGVAIGFFIVLVSVMTAITAAVFESRLLGRSE
jgi:hypothetical protein